jgi:hypothetical protein
MKNFFLDLLSKKAPPANTPAPWQAPATPDTEKNFPEAIALNELDRLAEIIARHEKHAFTVKAFLAAVITGLATMVYSLNSPMEPTEFALLSAGVIAAFALWSTAHRILAAKAIRRTSEIERSLRLHLQRQGHQPPHYAGPQITEVMAAHSTSKEKRQSFIYKTHSIPLTIAATALVFLCAVDYSRFHAQNQNTASLRSALTEAFQSSNLSTLNSFSKCNAVLKSKTVVEAKTQKPETRLEVETISCDLGGGKVVP